MEILRSVGLVLWYSVFNLVRRHHWNRRYKRCPKSTIKEFMTEFREYLSRTPSQAMGRNREEGKSAGFTLAPVTVGGYMRIVSKIVRDQGTVFPTKKQMYASVTHLKEKRASYSHICGTASCLEWLSRFWRMPVKIARPRKPERCVREVLSEREIKALMEACRTKREKALMALSAWGGLRTSELSRVRVLDLDLKNLIVNVVCGKYFRDRASCITQECADALEDYIKQAKKDREDLVFTKCTGSIRRTMHRIRKRTDVQSPSTPQKLRRSLATNLHRRGADIAAISAQLGHKEETTTWTSYIKCGPEMHRQSFDRYAPIYQDSQMDRHIQKFITGEFTFGADPLNIQASHFKPEMGHLLSVQQQLKAYAEALSQRVTNAIKLPAKGGEGSEASEKALRKGATQEAPVVEGKVIKGKEARSKRPAKDKRAGAMAKTKEVTAKKRGRPKRDRTTLTERQQLILKQLTACTAPLTNRLYRELTDVSRHIASTDIMALCSLGLIQRDPDRAGRATCYWPTSMAMAAI